MNTSVFVATIFVDQFRFIDNYFDDFIEIAKAVCITNTIV